MEGPTKIPLSTQRPRADAATNKAQGMSLPAVAVLQQKSTGNEIANDVLDATGEMNKDPIPVASFMPAGQGNRLPAQLQQSMESISGFSLKDVNVHYNSDKPAQLQAHAFAQGSNIHVASGQERYLAHEAWHVVQQKQGRVESTVQRQGAMINDDVALENEADTMGAKAVQLSRDTYASGFEQLNKQDIGDIKGRSALVNVSQRQTLDTINSEVSSQQGVAQRVEKSIVVEDDVPPGEWQITKSRLMDRLRDEIRKASKEILEPEGLAEEHCPDLNYWLAFYQAKDVNYIHQAMARYAPATAEAGNAAQFISSITDRVRSGMQENIRTGSPDVVNPEKMPEADAIKHAEISASGRPLQLKEAPIQLGNKNTTVVPVTGKEGKTYENPAKKGKATPDVETKGGPATVPAKEGDGPQPHAEAQQPPGLRRSPTLIGSSRTDRVSSDVNLIWEDMVSAIRPEQHVANLRALYRAQEWDMLSEAIFNFQDVIYKARYKASGEGRVKDNARQLADMESKGKPDSAKKALWDGIDVLWSMVQDSPQLILTDFIHSELSFCSGLAIALSNYVFGKDIDDEGAIKKDDSITKEKVSCKPFNLRVKRRYPPGEGLEAKGPIGGGGAVRGRISPDHLYALVTFISQRPDTYFVISLDESHAPSHFFTIINYQGTYDFLESDATPAPLNVNAIAPYHKHGTAILSGVFLGLIDLQARIADSMTRTFKGTVPNTIIFNVSHKRIPPGGSPSLPPGKDGKKE